MLQIAPNKFCSSKIKNYADVINNKKNKLQLFKVSDDTTVSFPQNF